MKVVDFLRTGMENFCCYIEPMEYDFKNNKITLITGPNGVGKSSIIDSVLFTLFGVTTKDGKSTDVVNNVTGKNCHTYLNFLVNNDNSISKYRIDRYVKHSKLGDTVLLFKDDDKKPYKKGQREVLPEIEKILLPQKLMTNTMLFGQKVKDFFTDLTDTDRKEIFRKVIQLDDYVMYYDNTSKKIKETGILLDQIVNNITLNSKLFESTTKNIEITKEDKKNFENTKIQEIYNLTQKNQQLKQQLFELNQKLKSFENINDLELSTLNDNILTIQNNIDKLDLESKTKIESITNTKTLKESEFNSKSIELISKEKINKSKLISEEDISHQEKITKLNSDTNENSKQKNDIFKLIERNKSEIERNKIEILKLETALKKPNGVCPTCGKPLTDENLKKELTNHLNQLINTNNNFQIENENNLQLIKDIDVKLIQLDKNFETFLNSHEIRKNEIENNFKKIETEISEKLNVAKEKLNQLFITKKKEIEDENKSKKSSLEIELSNLKIKKDNLIKLIEEKKNLNQEILTKESDIKLNQQLTENKQSEQYNDTILKNYIFEKQKIEEELKTLNINKVEIEESMEILNFWKTGFSSTGIPSLLIDESIPFLNERVNTYLEMVGGRYKVSFDTLSVTKSGEYRDKINVNVLDTHTKANNRKQLSGGQVRIIDIAILLSLCDLQNQIQNMTTNILLLDEIFDSLDDDNIGYVSKLLRTLVKDKSITIISHRHIDSIEADEVLRLF